jgi:hypothetical protein
VPERDHTICLNTLKSHKNIDSSVPAINASSPYISEIHPILDKVHSTESECGNCNVQSCSIMLVMNNLFQIFLFFIREVCSHMYLYVDTENILARGLQITEVDAPNRPRNVANFIEVNFCFTSISYCRALSSI